MKDGALPEGLNKILVALRHDPHLRKWFEGLTLESSHVRAQEFRATAKRIGASEEHRELQHALALLALPDFYESTLQALDALAPG